MERAVDAEIPQVSGSCADMLAHFEAMWTFVRTPGVGPANNHAERVLTVTHTLRKAGRPVLDFFQESFEAWVNGAAAPKLLATH